MSKFTVQVIQAGAEQVPLVQGLNRLYDDQAAATADAERAAVASPGVQFVVAEVRTSVTAQVSASVTSLHTGL